MAGEGTFFSHLLLGEEIGGFLTVSGHE
jgi:hypothetical protein